MNVDAYLERIRYDGSRRPTAATLRDVHRAHMLAVPFENLDIALGRPITLAVSAFYDKIVHRRRGGFCYELNGLFAWLLEQLGFAVTLFSARVFQAGGPGPEFDHMLLSVALQDPWIADVGFGDSFREPLLFAAGEQQQVDGTYRLTATGSDHVLERRLRVGSDWEPQYVFSDIPRRLDDFADMCHYQQTSPDSVFTRKSVCSLATPEGRITLSHGRLLETAHGRRDERDIGSAAEYRALLADRFGIRFEDGIRIERLMPAG